MQGTTLASFSTAPWMLCAVVMYHNLGHHEHNGAMRDAGIAIGKRHEKVYMYIVGTFY